MNRTRFLFVFQIAVVPLLLLTLATSSFAGDKDKAKAHFASGKALMKVDNFDGATLEFEASVANYPTKNALFNLGQCYRALSKYGEALAVLERLKKDFGDSMSRQMTKAVAEIYGEIKSLAANLKVEVDQPEATISVDGKIVGQSPLGKSLILPPGRHRVEVILAGYENEKRQVRLMSRDNKVESFELRAVQQNEPTPQEPDTVEVEEAQSITEPVPEHKTGAKRLSVWSWSGVAATGAFAVATAVVGGLYLRSGFEYEDYADKIANSEDATQIAEWKDEQRDVRDKALKFQPATIGLIAATGALAIATTVLVIIDLKKTKRTDTESDSPGLTFVPGGLSLTF